MKAALLILGLCLTTAYSSIISLKPERKLADPEFLKHQKQVLDLFVGIGHNDNFHNEHSDHDLLANAANFVKPEVVTHFLSSFKHSALPENAVFSMYCHHTRHQTKMLFDLFYFAKDFDTFYKAASWARKHVNPIQFVFAYSTAIFHREDCKYYTIPPFYEVVPNYYVPSDTMHEVYDAKMLEIKERKFSYNNTGYEYNYHDAMFGGPLDEDAVGQIEHKISYFREDVTLNNWYAGSILKFPTWMNPAKYRGTHWYRRGETLYYRHQQIFARYTLERLSNELPFVEGICWDKPIKVGYNPRLDHINGQSLFIRPDNLIPKYFNKLRVNRAKTLERRILDAIDAQTIWEGANQTLHHLKNDDTDLVAQIVFGTEGRPGKKYYGYYFWEALAAISYVSQTSSDKHFIGGATSIGQATLRDPAFYQLLGNIIRFFQYQKRHLPHYTHDELTYTGVEIKDFEVDKLVTYCDYYEFEVTNAVPVKERGQYTDIRYYARQEKLNHKPFNFKIKVTSDVAKEALVRVYIGPKYDSEEHELNINQGRLAFVEIDHFPVKLAAGENVFERNSKESAIFSGHSEGFRSLYNRINNALKNSEQYYYSERHSCGLPNSLILPRGWKSGQPLTVAVVITEYTEVHNVEDKDFYAPCGGTKYYDGKPLGFPFDRDLDEGVLDHVPNIFFKDVLVYHKKVSDVNRSDQ